MAPPTSLIVAASSQSVVQYPGVVGAGVVVVVVVVVEVDEAAAPSALSVDVAEALAALSNSSMEMVEVGGEGQPMNSVVALET